MRITALNPPFLPGYSRGQRSPAVPRSGCLYYPIWLSYAVAALEQAGHEVQFIDAPAMRLSSATVLESVRDFAPSMVVVETSTPSIALDVRIADELAAMGFTVLLAGTHPSALPEETIAMGSAFRGVVAGEYEKPLLGAAEAIAGEMPLEIVPGLVLRTEDGTVATPRAEPLEDLDSLPFVSGVYARHLPVRRYSNPNALHPQVMIMGGRGCPNHCTFCVFPQTLTGHVFRARSPVNIVDEVEWVAKNMPEVRAIFFEDDTMTADRERLAAIARELIQRRVSLSWSCNMRADMDFDTLLLCRKAGLRTVCVGFESGSDRILAAMGKNLTTERMRRFASDCRRARVRVHGCFMVGTRGETRATMEETLSFALELNPDTAQFYPLMVYPGTIAYRLACEDGCIVPASFREWLKPDGTHNCVVRTVELSPGDLVDFCDRARRKFYLRPRYLLGKFLRTVGDRDERRSVLLAFRTFRRHMLRRK
ncbi:MAG: radical SAM protein [Candidatus Fermentibacteraceae bacterium]